MLPIFNTRTSAAWLSVFSNLSMATAKAVVGVVTGSLAVLSDALDGGMDLLASLVTLYSIRQATRPADEEHPFGHGKMENISGTVEAAIILLGGGIIVYQAVGRLMEGIGPRSVDLGLGMMVVSLAVNGVVGRYLMRVARREDSIALEAEARHLFANVYQSLGVFVGLGLVRLTGIGLFDAGAALGIGLLLLGTAYGVGRRSLGGLVDQRLPEAEEKIIVDSIVEHYGEFVGFHELRTRKAGSERYIDLHLLFSPGVSLEQAHALTEHLEGDIARKLPQSRVTIHIEPCDADCLHCPFTCRFSQGEMDRPV